MERPPPDIPEASRVRDPAARHLVLLVDDDETPRVVARASLESAGFDVGVGRHPERQPLVVRPGGEPVELGARDLQQRDAMVAREPDPPAG